MKKVKFLTGVAAFAVILSLNSCAKDGPTGPAGTNGTNGVANISSNIYSITPGSWSAISGGYAVNISDNSISNANTDGMEIFISANGTTWLGLPSSNLLVNGDQMEFDYQNGQIGLIYLYSSAPTTTLDLKVVVIPPAELILHPNTNWNDYNQVNSIMQSERVNK